MVMGPLLALGIGALILFVAFKIFTGLLRLAGMIVVIGLVILAVTMLGGG